MEGSSTLTAMGGKDSILVWGESDFEGVGKCGQGKSDTVGEVSGDMPSFAFSCWYSIQAATSCRSALMRFAQNVMTPSAGSFSFLYSTRSCWRCIGVSFGKTEVRVSVAWACAGEWTHGWSHRRPRWAVRMDVHVPCGDDETSL